MKILSSQIIDLANPSNQVARLGTFVKNISDNGVYITKTVKFTSATAGTKVQIISDADVDTDRTLYIEGITVTVNGATAWTDATATKITITDGTINAVAIAKAGLTGNAVLSMTSANLTIDNAVLRGTGMTAGKGVYVIGDANFGAGSDIYVAVRGVLK